MVITRSDLSYGYQSQQSCHSVADFAHEFPQQFNDWKQNSNSIICLQVNNEKELDALYQKLSKLTPVTKFYEPDLNDELTSICLYADKDVRKKVSYLPLLGKPKKSSFNKVISDMINTPQTNTQNVLEQGLSVHNKFKQLLSGDTSDWKLPNWFIDNKDFILNNLHDINTLIEYHILHDIGKPYCIEYDSDGKRHFPDHVTVSYKTYKKISNNQIIADLIKKDMIVHTIKSDEINKFIDSNDIKTILSLLITSLCEIHANS